MGKACPNTTINNARCTCTATGCPTHGNCCDCLHKHLAKQQLPACCFPPEVEKQYDRSFRNFVKTYQHLL